MNPLQNLKDIRTPTAIELWPPAYGWWILVALVVIGIFLLTIWLIKTRKIRRAKRQTLQALQQIDSSNLDSVSQLNQLLKRVAIVYFPNVAIQKLYGNQWAEFLAQALSDSQAIKLSTQLQNLQAALYRKPDLKTGNHPLDIKEYKDLAATWIKQAVPPSNKTKQKLEQNYA